MKLTEATTARIDPKGTQIFTADFVAGICGVTGPAFRSWLANRRVMFDAVAYGEEGPVLVGFTEAGVERVLTLRSKAGLVAGDPAASVTAGTSASAHAMDRKLMDDLERIERLEAKVTAAKVAAAKSRVIQGSKSKK